MLCVCGRIVVCFGTREKRFLARSTCASSPNASHTNTRIVLRKPPKKFDPYHKSHTNETVAVVCKNGMYVTISNVVYHTLSVIGLTDTHFGGLYMYNIIQQRHNALLCDVYRLVHAQCYVLCLPFCPVYYIHSVASVFSLCVSPVALF